MHLWLPILYGTVYITFTGIYFAATNDTVYTILDYEDGVATAMVYIFGILVIALPVVHLILFGLYWFRVSMYKANCGTYKVDQV